MKNDSFYQLVGKNLKLVLKIKRIPKGLFLDYTHSVHDWLCALPPSGSMPDGRRSLFIDGLDSSPSLLVTQRKVSFFVSVSMNTYLPSIIDEDERAAEAARYLRKIQEVTRPFVREMDLNPYSRALSSQPLAFGLFSVQHERMPASLSSNVFLSINLELV